MGVALLSSSSSSTLSLSLVSRSLFLYLSAGSALGLPSAVAEDREQKRKKGREKGVETIARPEKGSFGEEECRRRRFFFSFVDFFFLFTPLQLNSTLLSPSPAPRPTPSFHHGLCAVHARLDAGPPELDAQPHGRARRRSGEERGAKRENAANEFFSLGSPLATKNLRSPTARGLAFLFLLLFFLSLLAVDRGQMSPTTPKSKLKAYTWPLFSKKNKPYLSSSGALERCCCRFVAVGLFVLLPRSPPGLRRRRSRAGHHQRPAQGRSERVGVRHGDPDDLPAEGKCFSA